MSVKEFNISSGIDYFKAPRLGINIDHVATLRQAREVSYPSVQQAAEIVLGAGAQQITVHLREDRRHIQDFDLAGLRTLTLERGRLLNFEMGASDEILKIAQNLNPDWICLVPEKREEKTTEGGLNLQHPATFEKISRVTQEFKAHRPEAQVSLFLESDQRQLDLLMKFPVGLISAVEIHTGSYAHSFLKRDFANFQDSDFYLEFSRAKKFIKGLQIGCHGGHGLTLESTIPLVMNQLFEEYNIGHWVISQAIFQGLHQVVYDLGELLHQPSNKMLSSKLKG
jgi:pyridoxine 5-phosphate synthase